MAAFVRNGRPGRGAQIRATGPRYRLCQAADEARGKRNAPSAFYEPHPDSGEVDRSWSASQVVVTREDARIARTLRGPLHLSNVNGPLWTRRQSGARGPSQPEVDVMSTDGIVNPVTGE